MVLVNLCGVTTLNKTFVAFIVSFVEKDPVDPVPGVVTLNLWEHGKQRTEYPVGIQWASRIAFEICTHITQHFDPRRLRRQNIRLDSGVQRGVRSAVGIEQHILCVRAQRSQPVPSQTGVEVRRNGQLLCDGWK
jgi:hypothetical protein